MQAEGEAGGSKAEGFSICVYRLQMLQGITYSSLFCFFFLVSWTQHDRQPLQALHACHQTFTLCYLLLCQVAPVQQPA